MPVSVCGFLDALKQVCTVPRCLLKGCLIAALPSSCPLPWLDDKIRGARAVGEYPRSFSV